MECSQAADRLTKKTVNPEIESDYERGNDENPPKRQKSKENINYFIIFYFTLLQFNVENPSEISSLNSVPFTGMFL